MTLFIVKTAGNGIVQERPASPDHWITDQEHKHRCSSKQRISMNGECTVNLYHFRLVNKETRFK